MYQTIRSIRSVCAVAAAMIAITAVQAHAVGSNPLTCRRAITLQAAKFERARLLRLKTCNDLAQAGKAASKVDACFGVGDTKMDLALAGIKKAIANACCGKNKICNPADTGDNADLTIAEMEWDNRVKVCASGNRANQICASNGECPGVCVGGTEAGRDCVVGAVACGGGGVCTGGADCALPTAGPSYCPTLESGKLPNYTAPDGGPVVDALACGTCRFGEFDGARCRIDEDCGTACEGGSNDGNACTVAGDCPGGSCRSGTCKPSFTLNSSSDIADCAACFGIAAVEQMSGLGYDDLNPVDTTPGMAAAKLKVCKRTIGAQTRLFYDKRRNFMRLCEDKKERGLVASCPDGTISTPKTAAFLIEKARLAMIKAISDPAVGKCKTNTISEIGAPVTCPAVGGCGGPIDTPAQLATCLACVAEFKTNCADAVGATFPTPETNEIAATCNPTCGNGAVNVGETCDDGNVLDGDGCPSDCTISPCVNSGSTVTATVSFTPPAGVSELSAMTIYVQYPESKVRIPGQGGGVTVQDSIASDALFTPNDLDYALNIVLNQPDVSTPINSPAFDITFQTCTGAPAPVSGDFRCLLRDGTDTTGKAVYGGSCSVSVP